MWVHHVHMSTDTAHPWIPSDNFGTRLVLARRELGLTVKEAAVRCGLHYATWSTWENGRKPADMAAVVKAISDGLGVSRGWLMWGVAPPQSPGTRHTPAHDALILQFPRAA